MLCENVSFYVEGGAMENLNKKLDQLAAQVSAVQNAQAFAIAALFGELARADAKSAQNALGMLRMCSAAPMPAEDARALEELAAQWQELLQDQ